MYQYILFDLDGTIIDSEKGILNCVQYALQSFGIDEPDRTKLLCFIGPPLVDSFQEFYHFTPEEAKRATEKYRERYREKGLYEVEVYAGVENMLKELKAQGKTLALATSKPEIFAGMILKNVGLYSYFDVVVGSELDGTRDKKEDVIREVFARLENPERSQVIMVGDRKYDILGAKAWNVDSVGVTYGFAPEGELEENGATYIAHTPEDVVINCCKEEN